MIIVSSKKIILYHNYWLKNKGFDRHQAAREIPLDSSKVYQYVRHFKKGWKPTGTKNEKRPTVHTKSGGGIEAFRDLYDDNVIIPQLIEAGIEKYLVSESGDPDWMRDKDFRDACGVSVGKWRRYADDYKHLQVSKGGEIFWGHPDIIDAMRRAVQR